MIRTSTGKVGTIRRTIKGEYPSLPYACKLHPDWDRSVDIFPGTVMGRVESELVAPFGIKFGENTANIPFGLSGLFVAPAFGVDECVGTNNFAVWVGDSEGVFRVLAPAFDQDVDWAITPGTKQMVYAKADNALLTTTKNGEPVGTLIEANLDEGWIRINLDKNAPAAAGA